MLIPVLDEYLPRLLCILFFSLNFFPYHTLFSFYIKLPFHTDDGVVVPICWRKNVSSNCISATPSSSNSEGTSLDNTHASKELEPFVCHKIKHEAGRRRGGWRSHSPTGFLLLVWCTEVFRPNVERKIRRCLLEHALETPRSDISCFRRKSKNRGPIYSSFSSQLSSLFFVADCCPGIAGALCNVVQ